MAFNYAAFDYICNREYTDSRGYVALIVVYFDATYNQPFKGSPEPVMHSLGAYSGKAENWIKFRKEWCRELEKHGLEFFHMTDYEWAKNQVKKGKELPTKNPYKGWQLADFEPFLKRLHNVINRKNKYGKYRLESWTSTVLQKDFDETIPPELVRDVQCSSPYIFNVVQVLKAIHQFAKIKDTEPIQYVFSGGDGEGSRLGALFDDMWKSPVAKSIFKLDKGYARLPYEIQAMKATPALQAADIAAYEMQKFALRAHEMGYPRSASKRLFRPELISLGQADHGVWIYRAKELRISFAEIVQHNATKKLILDLKRQAKKNEKKD